MENSPSELIPAWLKLQKPFTGLHVIGALKERTIAEIEILERLIANGCEKIPHEPMGTLWLLNDRLELLNHIKLHPMEAQ